MKKVALFLGAMLLVLIIGILGVAVVEFSIWLFSLLLGVTAGKFISLFFWLAVAAWLIYSDLSKTETKNESQH